MRVITLLFVLLFLIGLSNSAQALNHALLFNNMDDYISVPDSNDWNFGDRNFTIEAWVKLNSVSEGQYMLAQWTDGGMFQQGFLFNFSNGLGLQWYGYEDGWIVNLNQGSNNGWITDTWYHVAVARDENKWTLYKNGMPLVTTINSGTLPNVNAPLTIGSRWMGSEYGHSLGGYMDEPRIWDYGRTQEQIQELMDYSLRGNEPGLIASWNFDEASGNIAYDITNNGHNGEISFGIDESIWVVSDSPIQPTVPEPLSCLLFGIGAGVLTLLRRD